MRHHLWILLFGLAFLALSRPAPGRPDPGDRANGSDTSSVEEVEVFWQEAPTLVPVRLVFPDGFDRRAPHTLIVALHGYGSSAMRFRRVAQVLADAGFVVALPEATYPLLTGGDLGFDWTLTQTGEATLEERAMRLLGSRYLPTAIEEIRSRCTIDEVYFLGFSQGAVVALLAGIYNHSIADGVISFGLPGYDPSWFEEDVLRAGRDVRVLLVHGGEDERVSPGISVRARDHLAEAGYEVFYRPFTGGHSVPTEQLRAAAAWIEGLDPEPSPPTSLRD